MERKYGHVFKIFFLRRMKHRFFDVILMNRAAGGSAQKDSATGGNPPDQDSDFLIK